MAASITSIQKTDIGGATGGRSMCVIVATGNLGNPYAAGGILFDETLINTALAASSNVPAGASISDIHHITAESESGTYRYRRIASTDKIKAWVEATDAEAGAIDLSAEVVHFTIIAEK